MLDSVTSTLDIVNRVSPANGDILATKIVKQIALGVVPNDWDCATSASRVPLAHAVI